MSIFDRWIGFASIKLSSAVRSPEGKPAPEGIYMDVGRYRVSAGRIRADLSAEPDSASSDRAGKNPIRWSLK